MQTTKYTLGSLLLKLERTQRALPPALQLVFASLKFCKIFMHLLTGTLRPSIERNVLLLSPG